MEESQARSPEVCHLDFVWTSVNFGAGRLAFACKRIVSADIVESRF